MVRIIVGCDTQSLRSDAARRLMLISEFSPALLAGYKRTQPDRYARLVGEPEIRAYADENGLD
ncbi:MAG: hypothetical protein P8M11_06825 [Planctomycetota bacterium]|nr:hypothetical protein [Planctomycetota bacterium]